MNEEEVDCLVNGGSKVIIAIPFFVCLILGLYF